MWNNYFFQIQKKYNMRISTKSPLVLRFDGRQVTKNKDINLIEKYDGSFLDSLEKTAKYFSEKYHCYSIFGSDEINFIVLEPNLVVEDLEPSDKTTHSHELLALFSQYFFDYFNHFDSHQKIFWHGKCFSIPKEKVNSYIKYRSGIIKNVLITYFAKKNDIDDFRLNLKEKIEVCKSISSYDEFKKNQDGILYYDGYKINLNDWIEKGEINKIIEENIFENSQSYIDIEDIDIELL